TPHARRAEGRGRPARPPRASPREAGARLERHAGARERRDEERHVSPPTAGVAFSALLVVVPGLVTFVSIDGPSPTQPRFPGTSAKTPPSPPSSLASPPSVGQTR